MAEVIIIGEKPYTHLPFNNIIDKFEENCRCNFGLPNQNNGTKYDKLGLCNHLYHYLIIEQNLDGTPRDRDTFLKTYGKTNEEKFLSYYYDSFFKEHKSKYKEIFHAQHKASVCNKMLVEWGCPYRFSNIPRTGQTIIFENLLKKNKVFVAFFSLMYDKVKVSRHTRQEFMNAHPLSTPYHCGEEESNILAWLHEKELVDATLCMLEDEEVPTLNCKDLKPSKFILNLLREEFDDVIEII